MKTTMLVLLAAALTACGGRSTAPLGRPMPGATPIPVTATAATTALEVQSADNANAWAVPGEKLICVRKNFFAGDQGNYKAHGNRINWHGREKPVVDRGDALCADFRMLRRVGLAQDGDVGCLQFSSGMMKRVIKGKEQTVPNWMNFLDGFLVEATQVYHAPDGAFNLSYRVLKGGVPVITNQGIDEEGDTC